MLFRSSRLYSDLLDAIQLGALPPEHLTLAAVEQSDYERWLGDHRCSRHYFTILVCGQYGWESFLEAVEHWVKNVREVEHWVKNVRDGNMISVGVNMH